MADRKRVLVADDDPDLIELLRMDLGYQGYEVVCAVNGKEALRLATTELFDICLLDVMMPYIDGYHVAYEIGTKLGSKAPKVVIMTSRDTVKEKGVALMSGALSVIQKPFDMEQLHRLLDETISKA
jgi:DNA-binding response OmpR family regulator